MERRSPEEARDIGRLLDSGGEEIRKLIGAPNEIGRIIHRGFAEEIYHKLDKYFVKNT